MHQIASEIASRNFICQMKMKMENKHKLVEIKF